MPSTLVADRFEIGDFVRRERARGLVRKRGMKCVLGSTFTKGTERGPGWSREFTREWSATLATLSSRERGSLGAATPKVISPVPFRTPHQSPLSVTFCSLSFASSLSLSMMTHERGRGRAPQSTCDQFGVSAASFSRERGSWGPATPKII